MKIPSSFTQIYRTYYDQALRYATGFTRSEDAGKDVVHDAYLYLLEHNPEPRKPKAALFTALFIAGRKHEAYSFNSHKRLDDVAEPEVWDRQDAELPNLPPKYKRLIEQKMYGFSNEEIAKIEGITESGVRVRLHRARKLVA